jgi:hypothetical protein
LTERAAALIGDAGGRGGRGGKLEIYGTTKQGERKTGREQRKQKETEAAETGSIAFLQDIRFTMGGNFFLFPKKYNQPSTSPF